MEIMARFEYRSSNRHCLGRPSTMPSIMPSTMPSTTPTTMPSTMRNSTSSATSSRCSNTCNSMGSSISTSNGGESLSPLQSMIGRDATASPGEPQEVPPVFHTAQHYGGPRKCLARTCTVFV
mmetsp:Transcript_13283/g.19942  ORF Transcript_13283/g.19942 Transcript_13283/m.19942 type:complete len:122 (-) Transcript_13283:257-622(-)